MLCVHMYIYDIYIFYYILYSYSNDVYMYSVHWVALFSWRAILPGSQRIRDGDPRGPSIQGFPGFFTVSLWIPL